MLVSGVGTNLRAMIEAAAKPDYPARIVLVMSNRPSSTALRVAADAGIPTVALPVSQFGGDSAARDLALRDRLLASGVQLVVCAGYDRMLSDAVLLAFKDAIMNVHPSLLPAFPGDMYAVEEALAFGVKVSG